MLGTTASTHVKAMHRETCPQPSTAQTAHVAGLSGTFQAMNHDDFARCGGGRTLRLNQDFDTRLRPVKPPTEGKASLFAIPDPEMGGDGLEVRVSE